MTTTYADSNTDTDIFVVCYHLQLRQLVHEIKIGFVIFHSVAIQ